MDSGDEHEGSSNQHQRKQRQYHRHTPRQIQQLEAMFKECPHPDENQRAALGQELDLEPQQIKFWFQNRRTQMKAQHERASNSFLRMENDKIRCENITMREALRNVVCPNCVGQPVTDYFNEQNLRMENTRLKQELDRLSSITSKYLGRPLTQGPPTSVPSLDLSVGGMPGAGLGGGPSLDLDLLSGCSSAMLPPVAEMERPMMVDLAARAMDELIRLAQAGRQLWDKGAPGGAPETLSVAAYDGLFAEPGGAFRPPDISVEGSRDSGLVFMSAVALVDVFMDTNKWTEFFPGIVSKAHTGDVIMSGGLGGSIESLVMMYEELHMVAPVVPTREFSFLRYCKQIEPGLWAVADVSPDALRGVPYGMPPRSRRLPSGCLIADMPNGYSNVTWVEHMEFEHTAPISALYRSLVLSGAAFGAHRWLAALQRACERVASLAMLGPPHHDLAGAGVTPEGKRSTTKLSRQMVRLFCASLSSSPLQRWVLLPGATDVSVRVGAQRSAEPGQPTSVVLTAATSIWLPVPAGHAFAFLRDETARSQWDILAHANQVQEVLRIASGSNPDNCVSVLRGMTDANQDGGMLILQESSTDASGSSLVVYSPIDLLTANVVMSGEDASGVPLLPSGFAILPDVRPGPGAGASSSSGGGPLGTISPGCCVVTVAFQIRVSSLPSARVDAESMATVTGLIGNTVQQIKAALNCAGP